MQYNKTKEELINEVLDNFDFVRVHEVMKFLDWKWYDFQENTYKVPSIPKLIHTAEKYLSQAYDGLAKSKWNSNEYVTVSGGFEAWAKRYPAGLDKPDVLLILNFNLATWEAAAYDR